MAECENQGIITMGSEITDQHSPNEQGNHCFFPVAPQWEGGLGKTEGGRLTGPVPGCNWEIRVMLECKSKREGIMRNDIPARKALPHASSYGGICPQKEKLSGNGCLPPKQAQAEGCPPTGVWCIHLVRQEEMGHLNSSCVTGCKLGLTSILGCSNKTSMNDFTGKTGFDSRLQRAKMGVISRLPATLMLAPSWTSIRKSRPSWLQRAVCKRTVRWFSSLTSLSAPWAG